MVRSKPSHLRRVVAVLLLTVALVPMLAGGADAGPTQKLICTASGTVVTTPGLPDTWTVAGRGSCFGDGEGTYFLDFSGAGTSNGLGLCGEIFVVTNLNITNTLTLTNAATGVPRVVIERWTAPVTTYPLVTPYIVERNGGPVGVGVFWNHIFLNCAGSTVATFQWTTLV